MTETIQSILLENEEQQVDRILATGVKITRLVSKPLIAQSGAYNVLKMTEEQFKRAVATMNPDDVMGDTAFMARAIETVTGREVAIGSRSLSLGAGEAALVFEIDATDAFSKKATGSREKTFEDMEYIRSHSKMWFIYKIDIEGTLKKLSEMSSMGHIISPAIIPRVGDDDENPADPEASGADVKTI